MAIAISRETSFRDPVPSRNLPKVRITAPFRFTHHPTQWDVVRLETGELSWFPVLGKQHIDLGVNGVDERGDDTFARIYCEKNGVAIIRVDYGEYMVDVPTPAGISHRERWEQIDVEGGRQNTEYDTHGFQTWVLSLMERGLIAKGPSPTIARILLANWKQKLNRSASEYARRAWPGLEIRMNQLKTKIDFVENQYGRKSTVAQKVRADEGKPGETRGKAS